MYLLPHTHTRHASTPLTGAQCSHQQVCFLRVGPFFVVAIYATLHSTGLGVYVSKSKCTNKHRTGGSIYCSLCHVSDCCKSKLISSMQGYMSICIYSGKSTTRLFGLHVSLCKKLKDKYQFNSSGTVLVPLYTIVQLPVLYASIIHS